MSNGEVQQDGVRQEDPNATGVPERDELQRLGLTEEKRNRVRAILIAELQALVADAEGQIGKGRPFDLTLLREIIAKRKNALRESRRGGSPGEDTAAGEGTDQTPPTPRPPDATPSGGPPTQQ